MELKRALELHEEYNGVAGVIKCDGDYICLNDLLTYFPGKRIDHWKENDQTRDLIQAVEEKIIPGKAGIITKRGKGGGTFAHHLIALDFAAWLSVEFKLKIYMAYISGTQTKKDWNIIRELAAFNYKMMAVSVKGAHDEPRPYHFSNEALMLNKIVFGKHEAIDRNTLDESDLKLLTEIESKNAAYIDLGLTFQERKERLTKMYAGCIAIGETVKIPQAPKEAGK